MGKLTEDLDAYYFMVREPNGDIGHRFTDTFASLSSVRLGIILADMVRLAETHSGIDIDIGELQAAMDRELDDPSAPLTGQPIN